MFAPHPRWGSYNHYMLSTASFKRWACAGFEHLRGAPVPLLRQGRASPSAIYSQLQRCVQSSPAFGCLWASLHR